MVKRVLFVISSLSLGGAQRVMTNMANYWINKGIRVIIITFDEASSRPLYNLARDVKHVPLGVFGVSPNRFMGIWNNLKRILVLRKAIQQNNPDIVISFLDLTNVITLLATRGLNLPVIVMELSDPEMNPLKFTWRKLRLWTYPRADRVGVLSKKAQTYFPAGIHTRTIIIPNPVLLEEQNINIEETLPSPIVITIGRLAEEKRPENLLKAFSLLKNKYPEWSLVIVGNGPLRGEMESLRDHLGLSHQVKFLGLVDNPHSILKKADLFVLSSRFEGFPVALCEAMACGLPVISTEYHSGVREIIDDGVNGLLVPPEDVNALAGAMDRLMGDKPERKRLGAKAVGILDRFGLEKVMRMWEELIEQVVVEKKV